ncbi:MAG: hypothetical protein K2M05_07135 [Paramuribaculum sp.]|nr:hypothetical protein [Paramuribaculum sp.]MDE6304635.1 hypothetical protein [Paramuribaculum sp.]
MDFITVPLVLLIIGFFIYKLFELYVCKKERLYILEHLKDHSFDGMKLPSLNPLGLNMSFSAFKWGFLLLGLGLGILIAHFIFVCETNFANYQANSYGQGFQIILGACVTLFGGLGLIIGTLVELKIRRKDKK